MRTLATICWTAVLAASCSTANASIEIPVANGSFETPGTGGATYGTVDDWTIVGTGGVWNVNDNPSLGQGTDYWTTPAPERSQVGWLSVGPRPGSPSYFSQELSATLQANAIYTLTGFAGHPIGYGDTPPATTYSVALWAGGTQLAATAPTTGPEGSFEQFVLTFDSSTALPALLGQPLEIRLLSNQAQTAFDDIGLTVTPEPASLAVWTLLALGVSGLWRMRAAK